VELSGDARRITCNVGGANTEATDGELTERMADGDREAFAMVFRRHHATVFRFSRQMLGSTEAAEDVTQDVFVALAQRAGRYDPSRGSLTTYLYGIARHLVLQRHKRTRLRREVDVDDVSDEPRLASSSNPADELCRAQLVREVRIAILKLPVHYREVIVLCELNGLSYEDAAAIIDCPIGTVRSRLSRGRELLLQRCRSKLRACESPGGWKPCLTPTKNGC
jgi:RNA polymerase sigma-70 factor (ECF subfamily)